VADPAALEALGVGAGLGEVAGLLARVAHHVSVQVILPKPSPLDENRREKINVFYSLENVSRGD